MLSALGEGNNIVAVDLSSSYPDSAKQLKTVGYHRALNPEGIISMNPGLVIIACLWKSTGDHSASLIRKVFDVETRIITNPVTGLPLMFMIVDYFTLPAALYP